MNSSCCAGLKTSGTIFPLFAAGKGPMITAVLRIVERGEVDLDRPVAEYWPEFGVNGKDAVTLRKVHARPGKQPFGAPGKRNKGPTGIHYPALPVPALLFISTVINLVN